MYVGVMVEVGARLAQGWRKVGDDARKGRSNPPIDRTIVTEVNSWSQKKCTRLMVQSFTN